MPVETVEVLPDGTRITRTVPDATVAVTGPASDDDYVFESSAGVIRIKSMAKGKNPKPFAMMRAEATKNYAAMTLLIIDAKAGDRKDEVYAILDQLDESEFEAFTKGWQEHSGMGAGE